MGGVGGDRLPPDERAILRRYWLSPRLVALYVLAGGLVLFGASTFNASRELDVKWFRLTHTVIGGGEPAVVGEATRQRAILERSWRYRFRYALGAGPFVLGLGLTIPVMVRVARGSVAIRRARRGLCMKCGYDLRGSGQEGGCPECGGPPAPRRRTPLRRRDRWYGFARSAGTSLIVILLFALAFGGALPFRVIAGKSRERHVAEAFREAPRVTVRYGTAGSGGGSWQRVYTSDRRTGFTRQEWHSAGALTETLVDPVGAGCERYTPSKGVEQVARTAVAQRRFDYRQFEGLQMGVIASSVWYESERLASGPTYDVYRSVRPGGLHDHHAVMIEITLVETETHRPRHVWQGSFAEVLDPAAIPPLGQVSVTEIMYPEDAPGTDVLRIDPDRPGVLPVESPVFPAWLDRAWVDPVLAPPRP